MEALGPALGLDYGERRIGMAVSDAEGEFAFPLGALERADWPKDLARLSDLIEERGIRRIVVGLPLHLDGRPGEMAAAARSFASRLEAATGLPVALQDERWTSSEAERSLRETGGGRRRRKKKGAKGEVDAVAASILLRTWLERERSRAGAGA